MGGCLSCIHPQCRARRGGKQAGGKGQGWVVVWACDGALEITHPRHRGIDGARIQRAVLWGVVGAASLIHRSLGAITLRGASTQSRAVGALGAVGLLQGFHLRRGASAEIYIYICIYIHMYICVCVCACEYMSLLIHIPKSCMVSNRVAQVEFC